MSRAQKHKMAISVADAGCLSRILDPTFFHPGSRIRTVSIPDPNCLHPGSRIRIKEFNYFNPKKPKKWFLRCRKYDPGCSSRIPGSKRHRIPDLDPQHWWLHGVAETKQKSPPFSSLSGRTVDGPNGGAADEVRVLLVHRLQLHPHLEPVHLGRGRLLLEAPARQGGCNNDILRPNRKMQQRSFRYLTWELLTLRYQYRNKTKLFDLYRKINFY